MLAKMEIRALYKELISRLDRLAPNVLLPFV
jgi:hypothetical protein